MVETIAKLVRVVPTFSLKENGSTVHDYFEENKGSEGVVIVDGERPAGILMRNDFYQKIGRQFGYSLYMKRDLTLLMKADITCVDMGCDMAGFGFIAMNRKPENIYDFIVVLEDEKYAGTVSISEYLTEMSKTKEREIELLSERQHMLEQANEAEKLHRLEIERKNAAIKNLLDHAGQGFLFFGSDLMIGEEYSRECEEIFGFAVGSQGLLQVIENLVDESTLKIMENAFAHIFHDQDKIRNKVYLSILPGEFRIGGHYIQAEYKVIQAQTEKSVMMILTDITDKRAMEMKAAEEKSNIRLIIRAISSKGEINQAIEDLHAFFEQEAGRLLKSDQDTQAVLQYMFRMVHTMKGDFSLNSLHHTSAELHRLEDRLSAMLKDPEKTGRNGIREFVAQVDCDRLLARDIAIISEALGRHYFEKDDTYTVSRERIREIEHQVKTVLPEEADAVLTLLRSLFYINLKDAMKDYNDYVQMLAERFGKEVGDMKITGQDVYVDRERYHPLIKSLVHVFRNMADHGIEDPETRALGGKPEAGEITCELEQFQDSFVLSLSDDGKGIDPELIKSKAMEKGIYTAEEIAGLAREQVLETLFLDDFSTKNSVDLYSGRGVGLAAVRGEMEKLGGMIRVDTETGKYTRFKFIVPFEQE